MIATLPRTAAAVYSPPIADIGAADEAGDQRYSLLLPIVLMVCVGSLLVVEAAMVELSHWPEISTSTRPLLTYFFLDGFLVVGLVVTVRGRLMPWCWLLFGAVATVLAVQLWLDPASSGSALQVYHHFADNNAGLLSSAFGFIAGIVVAATPAFFLLGAVSLLVQARRALRYPTFIADDDEPQPHVASAIAVS
jgi:hypothetical protein